MRKTWAAVALGAIVLAVGVGTLLSQQNAEDAKFTKLVDTYLDEYWKFYPTSATLAGYYKHNIRLEDFSEANIEKRGNALDAVNKDLVTKIAADKLSPEIQIDRQQLLDAVDLELFRLENLVPQEYNPLLYNDIFLHSLRGLLAKDFEPLDARLKSATERAKLLPGLIKFAKENLKTPPKEYTEAAIKHFPAILAFYKTEVPGLVEAAGPDVKAKFQAELAKVTAALDDYGKFLQEGLLPKSTGNFRLGPEAHTKLLRLTMQGNLMIDELVARSNADVKNIRRDMAIICLPLYPLYYPNVNLDQMNASNQDAAQAMLIKGVLDKIKGAHVGREEWIGRIKTVSDEVKAFAAKAGLFDAPADAFAVEAMPPAFQGRTWIRLAGPAPYESGGPYTVQIQPIPADWPEETAQGILEEFNNAYMPAWVIGRIYPGSFVPAAMTSKSGSVLRKLHPNQPLLAGWPLYTEDMFAYAGFGDYDLKVRLSQLKLRLKVVMDFQMELNVHQGGYDKEKVVNYMTRGGFMTQAEAERRWESIILNPGVNVYPYAGYQEILDLEKDAKAAKGQAFNQKEFLQKLASFGPLPFRALKSRMAQ